MSDRDILAATIRERLDSWPNRSHLLLPGPYDLGAELVDYLSRSLAGWRPPAQVIETPTELDALQPATEILAAWDEDVNRIQGVVIRDADGDFYQRDTVAGNVRDEVKDGVHARWWEFGSDHEDNDSGTLAYPVTVVWSPTEKAGQ